MGVLIIPQLAALVKGNSPFTFSHFPAILSTTQTFKEAAS